MTRDVKDSLDPGLGLLHSVLRRGDGRLLRTVRAGDGYPAVVFEAGLGACASEWITVQRTVSAVTRTVSYDRAGHGGSTPDAQSRTISRIDDDLRDVVDAASPDRPVVLVAHSFGGPIVRHFAKTHPDRVAGIVLIDATRSETLPPAVARATVWMLAAVHVLYRLGIGARLMRRLTGLHRTARIPAADLEILERDLFSLRSAQTSVAEARLLPALIPHLAGWEADGLPPIPVISIVATGSEPADRKRREKTMLGPYRREMQRHPQGELRVVDSGHFVPQEHPQSTADAIVKLAIDLRQN